VKNEFKNQEIKQQPNILNIRKAVFLQKKCKVGVNEQISYRYFVQMSKNFI